MGFMQWLNCRASEAQHFLAACVSVSSWYDINLFPCIEYHKYYSCNHSWNSLFIVIVFNLYCFLLWFILLLVVWVPRSLGINQRFIIARSPSTSPSFRLSLLPPPSSHYSHLPQLPIFWPELLTFTLFSVFGARGRPFIKAPSTSPRPTRPHQLPYTGAVCSRQRWCS